MKDAIQLKDAGPVEEPKDNHAYHAPHPDDETDPQQDGLRGTILAHLDNAAESLKEAAFLCHSVRDWGSTGRMVMAAWTESLRDAVQTTRELAER